MSSVLISKLVDFEFIINDDIYLSGSSYEEKKEVYNNFWQISFDEKFISQLSLKQLNDFLSILLKKRSEQIVEMSDVSVATFYLWFDKQSSQLCFNLLSGENIELPFACTVKTADSHDIILNKCVNEAQYPAIKWDDIEFIEKGDPGWDDDDDDPKKFILDVWRITLPFNDEIESHK